MTQLKQSSAFSITRRAVLLSAAVAAALASASGVRAATLYWDAGGADTKWATINNWDTAADGTGGDPLAAPGVADIAYFNISTLNSAQIVQLGANQSVLGLVFNSTGTLLLDTDGVANKVITLGTSGMMLNAGAGAVTFGTTATNHGVSFTLSDNQTWTNNSSNALVLNSGNTIALGAYALTFDGSGDITTGSGVISGTGSIIKTGTNSLTLAANNTYTGNVTIKNGTVFANNANALGTGGTVTLGDTGGSNSATLRLASVTVARPISLGTTSGTLTIGNNNGTLSTFSGGITLNGHDLVISTTGSGAGTTTISTGGISGAGSIINSGSGSMTNPNTTISAVISGAAAVVQNSATSILELSGANTNTGGLTIKQGTVVAGIGNATTVSGAAGPSAYAITLGDSTPSNTNSASLVGRTVTVSNPINVVAGSSGTLSIGAIGGANNPTYSGAITLANNLTVANIGTSIVNVNGGITGTGNLIFSPTNTGTFSVSTGSLNFTGTITNGGTGSGGTTVNSGIGSNVTNVIQNNVNSSLTLSAANTFTGNLYVKAGVVSVNNATGASSGTIYLGDAAGGNATVSLKTGVTTANAINIPAGALGTLIINTDTSNATATYTGNITLNGPAGTNLYIQSAGGNGGGSPGFNINGTAITGTGNIIFSNRTGSNASTITLNAATSINNVGTISNAATGTNYSYGTALNGTIGANVSQIIQNSTATSLTLGGANTAFAGPVSVQAGTLALGNTAALNSSNLVSVGTSASSAKFDIAGKSNTIAGLADYSTGGGTVTNSSATGATLTLGGSGTNSFSGAITESTAGAMNLAVNLTGGGTQTLSGASTYTGNTTVSGGTLTLSGSLSGPISYTGNITVNNGTFNITGSVTGVSSHAAGQKVDLVNGTSLGSATSGVGRLLLPSTPTLVGTTAGTTAINTGVYNTQIVPYLVGEAATGTGGLGTATGSANTFMTYNASSGLRPLNLTDEFDAWSGTFSGTGSAGNNVRVGLAGSATTATYNPTSDFAINSLAISSTTANALTISAGKTLTITSGALLVNQNSTTSIAGTGTLSFGTAEAMISPYVNTTIATPVSVAGGALTKSGSSNLTLSGLLTTTGDLTITDPTGATITATGGIASSGAANLVLKANSTGAMTYSTNSVNNSGTITNSGIGSAGVTISSVIGSNVTGITQNSTTSGLTVSGVANTFVGPVNVLAGTLTLANDGSLGAAGNGVTLNNNSTLIPIGIISSKHPITLNNGGILGTGVVAAPISGTGSLTIGGTVTLSGNNSFTGNIVENASTSLYVSSASNMSSGSLTLPASSNTFGVIGTSLTSFGSRTVTFTGGSSSTLTFDIQDPANTFYLDRNIAISPNSQTATTIAKSGQGTFSVQYALTTVNSGPTFGMRGGTLLVDAPNGGKLSNQKISFAGGTLYILGKTDSSFTQDLAGIGYPGGVNGVTAGGGNIVVDNNNSATTTTLNLGAINYVALTGASLNIATKNLGAGSAVVTTTTANDASGIIGGGRVTYTPAGSSTGFAYISGGTTIGAYAGGTAFVTSGSVASTNYALTGSASSVGTESVNTLSIATSGSGQSLAQTAATTLTLTTGGLLFTGSNDYAITGGTLKSNTATNSDLVVHQYGSGALTIGSIIANGVGTSTLTKDGPGKLILTGANTFTGATYVNGGTLSVDVVGELGATVTSAINLNGGTLQATNDITTTHTVSLGGSGGTLDVANGKTLNLNGVISSTGGLTIANSDAGNGTVVLGAANTFTGGLWINSGILKLNNSTALIANGNNALTFGTATTEKLQMNGNSAAVAGLTSSSANAVIENANASAATLSVNNGADNVFAGVLQDGTGAGKLSLIKGGGGKLTLSGNNTYTGTTTILSGILNVSGSTVSATTIGNGGTLNGSGTLGAVTIASGGLLSPGNSPGQLTVSSLLLNSGSTSHMEIGGTTLGSQYDNTTITSGGGLTYGGTLEIVSYSPYVINAQAGSYTLFSFTGGYSGELSTVTVDGYTLTNSSGVWTGTQGGVNYSFTDSTGIFAVTIPEPATMSLVAGMAGLGLLARRRRQA